VELGPLKKAHRSTAKEIFAMMRTLDRYHFSDACLEHSRAISCLVWKHPGFRLSAN